VHEDLRDQVARGVSEVFGIINIEEGLTTGEDVAKRRFQ